MGEALTRDRDADGRPRNARPRDSLGRPLARVPGTGPPAEPPALPPREALRRAQLLLDTGRPFEAHEVLEAVWKSTNGPGRALWRGLAQLAVGLTHRDRGNARGSAALLARAADTLVGVSGEEFGVPVEELRTWALDGGASPPPRLTVGQAAEDRA